jgi:hypothetical protein
MHHSIAAFTMQHALHYMPYGKEVTWPGVVMAMLLKRDKTSNCTPKKHGHIMKRRNAKLSFTLNFICRKWSECGTELKELEGKTVFWLDCAYLINRFLVWAGEQGRVLFWEGGMLFTLRKGSGLKGNIKINIRETFWRWNREVVVKLFYPRTPTYDLSWTFYPKVVGI